MELIVIRHGRPEASGTAGGDPPLTAEGRDQAGRLARFLAAVPELTPDRLYSSPMRRARQTADPIAARLGLDVAVDDRLAEFDVGAGRYVHAEDSRGDQAVAQWRVLESGVWGEHRFDPDAFERRVLDGFERVVADNPGGRVAVVCHNGVLNTYLCRLIGRDRGMFVQPGFTSFSRLLASRDGRRRLHSVNETPHLMVPSQLLDTAVSGPAKCDRDVTQSGITRPQ